MYFGMAPYLRDVVSWLNQEDGDLSLRVDERLDIQVEQNNRITDFKHHAVHDSIHARSQEVRRKICYSEQEPKAL